MRRNFRTTHVNLIFQNESVEGEMLETELKRIIAEGQPIENVSPQIYTERKDGIQPLYDIRTDRFELAVEAMDKVSATHLAKRQERMQLNDAKAE